MTTVLIKGLIFGNTATIISTLAYYVDPGTFLERMRPPKGFREQGNKRKINLGTQEQKHILGNTGTPKSKKYF